MMKEKTLEQINLCEAQLKVLREKAIALDAGVTSFYNTVFNKESFDGVVSSSISTNIEIITKHYLLLLKGCKDMGLI